MKHKVSELEGALLDLAVAKAEGVADGLVEKDGRMCRVQEWDPDGYCWRDSLKEWKMWMDYAPSLRWDQAGPIIERIRIDIGHEWQDGAESWRASIAGCFLCFGPTPLIAAMRTYVAAAMGDEVEYP